MDSVARIVVLFSGTGTNLENLIRRFHGQRVAGRRIEIVPVTNRPDAGGIAKAAAYGLESIVVDHRAFETREAFDRALVERILPLDPALTVMAGFMRILTPHFTRRIDAINLHPSLLPLFKGARAIERSFESGMKVGGVTVHRVTEELDSGEILAQRCVPIEEGESLAHFEAKIHAAEYELLPLVVQRLLEEG